MISGRPLGVLAAAFLALGSGAASAQETVFFRIASGPPGGTYFPISGVIAQIVSNPPGAQPCDRGGNCGVPGLLAIGQSAEGSEANVRAVAEGRVESAFVQSDIAYWAFSGTGPFTGQTPLTDLRAIASLYPEPVQVMVGPAIDADDIRGLKGKRIVVGPKESGTAVGARLVLKAYGLGDKGYRSLQVQERAGVELIRDGKADALIGIGGASAGPLAELARSLGGRLLPVEGEARTEVLALAPFYAAATIPGGTYPGNPDDIETVAPNALWITRASASPTLIHDIAKALFASPTARRVLNTGHPQAQKIALATALDGVAIPLHEGAERFYREIGLIDLPAEEETAAGSDAPRIQ